MTENRFWLVIIIAITLITSWINLPSDPAKSIDESRFSIVQGLDLQGGSRVLLRATINADDEEMQVARDIVEQRVSGLGLTEAVVQLQGSDRIIIELPGVSDRELALRAVQGTGLLEFVDFSTINFDFTDRCIITDEQIRLLKEQRLENPEQEEPLLYSESPQIETLTTTPFETAKEEKFTIVFNVYDNTPNVRVRLQTSESSGLDGFQIGNKPIRGNVSFVTTDPQIIQVGEGEEVQDLYLMRYEAWYTPPTLNEGETYPFRETFTLEITDADSQVITQSYTVNTLEEAPEITGPCPNGEFPLDRNGRTVDLNTVDDLDTIAAFTTAEANGQKLTGAIIDDAQAVAGNLNQWTISFTLTSEGDDLFATYTQNHIGSPMAIVLDGIVLSSPTIQSRISGQGQITGDFSREDAEVLAAQLRYGSLPVPFTVEAFDTIGPTLGEISIERSVRAGTIGVIVVLMFMIVYYRVPGVAAALALLVFASINFAVYKTLPVTLTLPAITGFLISIGTAVDGNILIFERMKEELRAGRSLEKAVELGFERAWTSIRDSNLSTIIIAFILFVFGSTFGASSVQGFAITLILGLVINLFTAVIVTRTFLGIMLEFFGRTLHRNRRLMGV